MKRSQILKKAREEFKSLNKTYHGWKPVKLAGVQYAPISFNEASCLYTSEEAIAEAIAKGSYGKGHSSSLAVLELNCTNTVIWERK
jgi:hypothetical protein